MWEEEQKREVATRRRRRMTSRVAKSNLSGTDAKLAPIKVHIVRRSFIGEAFLLIYITHLLLKKKDC